MLSDEVVCIRTAHRRSHAGVKGVQTRGGLGWDAPRAARMTVRGLLRLFINRHGTPAYLAAAGNAGNLTLSARTDDGLITDELLRLPECAEGVTLWPHAELVTEPPAREIAVH